LQLRFDKLKDQKTDLQNSIYEYDQKVKEEEIIFNNKIGTLN